MLSVLAQKDRERCSKEHNNWYDQTRYIDNFQTNHICPSCIHELQIHTKQRKAYPLVVFSRGKLLHAFPHSLIPAEIFQRLIFFLLISTDAERSEESTRELVIQVHGVSHLRENESENQPDNDCQEQRL